MADIVNAVDHDETLPDAKDPVLFAQVLIALVRSSAVRAHKWPSQIVASLGDSGWPSEKVYPEFHHLKHGDR